MSNKIIIEELKNTGLILADPEQTDYNSPLFGAVGAKLVGDVSPLKQPPILFPDGRGWKNVYETVGNPEIQFNKNFDTFSCVIFGIAKMICGYIYKRYGKLYTAEEMFNAYFADVIPNQGTKVKKGFESFRKKGWIEDGQFKEYTFDENTTSSEFFRKPPEHIIIKAAGKLDIWKVYWEVLPLNLNAIFEAYKRYPVGLTGFAWASYYGTGVYYDYNNQANHFFVGTEPSDSGNNIIYDTYPKDFKYVKNSQISAGDLFKELHSSFKYGSAHVCWVEPANNTIINKIMDKIIQLSNGALYWLKAGTTKAQHITRDNAGFAALTHIMRKYPNDVIHLKDEKELTDTYQLTEDYFGAPLQVGVKNI